MTPGNGGRSTRPKTARRRWRGKALKRCGQSSKWDPGRGKPGGGALHPSALTHVAKVDNKQTQQTEARHETTALTTRSKAAGRASTTERSEGVSRGTTKRRTTKKPQTNNPTMSTLQNNHHSTWLRPPQKILLQITQKETTQNGRPRILPAIQQPHLQN